jgi:hypothetical protein
MPRLAGRARGAWKTLLAREGAATLFLVLLVLPTNVYLFAWRMTDLSRHEHPYYLHTDEVAALAWLRRHASSSDVVLAPIDVGRFVPGYAGARPYLAHGVMTSRFYERRADVERFFDPRTDDGWRRQLLARWAVTFVLRTPAAGRGEGEEQLWSASLLKPVLLLPHAQLYRVGSAPPPKNGP